MTSPSVGTVLSLVGILVELGACIVLAGLMLGLRRQARQHEYFRLWLWGWIALSVAIGMITVRYVIMPFVAESTTSGAMPPVVAALYTIYQVAKFLFIILLALGVVSYVEGRVPARLALGTTAVGLAWALGSLGASHDLDQILLGQALFAAPVFTFAAWRMGSIPPERKDLGNRVTTVALVLLAILWVLYLIGFGGAVLGLDEGATAARWPRFFSLLTGKNSYFDAALFVLLGIGMVLTLVEHSNREGQAALAARIDELTAAQTRLAEILQAAHEGIVTVDRSRRIEEINEAAARLFGALPAACRGRPFDEFVRPDDRAKLWDQLALVVRRSEADPPVSARCEVTGVRADGSAFPVELALSSFGDGAVRGYVIVLRDLTEQRRAEQDQAHLQQHLAHAARLEAMGRMVSGVAHELNNPLTAITAFAQDLLQSPRSDEDREALTVIVQQTQRCRVIVGDLLIFARSRRDERRRVAPADLVGRVARVFERDSARHGVEFGVEVADDLPPVDVDPAGMEQVLTNLLTNAFQATPAGGRVELKVKTVGDRLELVVEDDGAGIARDAMPRLFEPFYTTKAPGQGTGLGLSVSHTIVQQHGGSIDAENRGDRPNGARFTVRLPYVDRRHDGAPDETERHPPAPKPAEPVRRRVLVVDDEAAIRSAIRRMLERRSWEVDEAADGQEALLKLEVGGRLVDYDAVVTDLRMPGMSGLDLYRRLEADHPSVLPRVVVVTGDTASPAVAEFLASLRSPYLQKPFDLRALLEMLERIAAATP